MEGLVARSSAAQRPGSSPALQTTRSVAVATMRLASASLLSSRTIESTRHRSATIVSAISPISRGKATRIMRMMARSTPAAASRRQRGRRPWRAKRSQGVKFAPRGTNLMVAVRRDTDGHRQVGTRGRRSRANPAGEVATPMNLQLVENVVHVALCGRDFDMQATGDQLVAQSVGNQLRNLPLARRQSDVRRGGALLP